MPEHTPVRQIEWAIECLLDPKCRTIKIVATIDNPLFRGGQTTFAITRHGTDKVRVQDVELSSKYPLTYEPEMAIDRLQSQGNVLRSIMYLCD